MRSVGPLDTSNGDSVVDLWTSYSYEITGQKSMVFIYLIKKNLVTVPTVHTLQADSLTPHYYSLISIATKSKEANRR